MVTVLISAWIPARRATRITAIEAIRQTKDINVKAKDVRTSKLTYRLFGLEGMLARKHFRRSRRRYRTTVVSLFMSIVLFISASSFSSYVKDSVTEVLGPRDYDISWEYDTRTYTEMTPRQVYEILAQTDGLTNSVYSFVKTGSAIVNEEYIVNEFKERFGGAAASAENSEEAGDTYEIPACIVIVPDEVLTNMYPMRAKRHRCNGHGICGNRRSDEQIRRQRYYVTHCPYWISRHIRQAVDLSLTA